MLNKYPFVIVSCLWSLSAIGIASTIELTPDEEMAPAKGWYTTKNWYPTKSSTAVKKYPVKYRHLEPVKTAVPMRIVKKQPPAKVPFPARIESKTENNYPWSITGSVGYSAYQQAGDSSGGTLVGRFGLGKVVYHSGFTSVGLEVGVQNGNRMSISASQATLDEMGSLPIWTTVKPMVDLLGTLQVGTSSSPAFFVLKGGIAYRTWETERQSINNLSQIGGEVQAGVGIPLAKKATLSLLYQGVFGASNDFTVRPDTSATVSNIPIQNGVLLSVSLLL